MDVFLLKSAQKLLSLLRYRVPYSEGFLIQELRVNKPFLHKCIEYLQKLGLSVFYSTQTKTLTLNTRIELLSKSNIINHLNEELLRRITLTVLLSTKSTNDDVLIFKEQSNKEIAVCVAEQQTCGRGRQGKKWLTSFGNGIIMSLCKKLNQSSQHLDGLSLVAGLAIIKTIKTKTQNQLLLKWPNDIMCQNKKLAGVLIELFTHPKSPTVLIVGLGINLKDTKIHQENIEQEIIALQDVSSDFLDRNHIIAELVKNIVTYLDLFYKYGFKYFAPIWMQYDYLFEKSINVLNKQHAFSGIAKGVTNTGALIVENMGEMKEIYSGEISIRKVNE